MKSAWQEQNKEQLQNIRSKLSEKEIWLNNLNQENGASTYLTTLPLRTEGYVLTKQLFWDLASLIRYDW